LFLLVNELKVFLREKDFFDELMDKLSEKSDVLDDISALVLDEIKDGVLENNGKGGLGGGKGGLCSGIFRLCNFVELIDTGWVLGVLSCSFCCNVLAS